MSMRWGGCQECEAGILHYHDTRHFQKQSEIRKCWRVFRSTFRKYGLRRSIKMTREFYAIGKELRAQ